MSFWDSEQGVVVTARPKPVEGFPNWWATDCGCCGGLQWGGESPRDCESCYNGWRYIHLPSRTVAAWPGGYLLGAKATDAEIKPIMDVLGESS